MGRGQKGRFRGEREGHVAATEGGSMGAVRADCSFNY